MRTLHLADASARDAFVRFVSVKAQPPPQKVVNGRPVSMRRFLAAGEANTHEALHIVHGLELAQALIDGDPVVNLTFFTAIRSARPRCQASNPLSSSTTSINWCSRNYRSAQ